MTAYVEIEDALQVVDRHGFHILDIGLLASALARAAQLPWVRRPLIDGNKRTAWTLMVLMLWINGYRHDFATDAAFDLVAGVAAGDVSLEVSAGLIATHRVRR